MRKRAGARPSFLVCGTMLALVRVSLRVLGYGRCVRLLRAINARLPAGEEAQPTVARDLANAIAAAGAFFPGRALCLEQSIALYLLLRMRGCAARLMMGVQPYPFAAHAWVEHGGTPINERADIVQRFIPLLGSGV